MFKVVFFQRIRDSKYMTISSETFFDLDSAKKYSSECDDEGYFSFVIKLDTVSDLNTYLIVY